MLRASGASSIPPRLQWLLDHPLARMMTARRAAAFRAVKCGALRPGHEIRRQPVLDVLDDDLSGAILRVAQSAGLSEALRLPRDVVGHARECHVVDHDLAGL